MNFENLLCPSCKEYRVEVSGSLSSSQVRTFCTNCEEIRSWEEFIKESSEHTNRDTPQ